MAEPGDPKPPEAPDHDDVVGFSSPSSLEGRTRHTPAPAPAPATVPEPEPEPERFAPLEPQPFVAPAPAEPVIPPVVEAPRRPPEPILESIPESIPEPIPVPPLFAPPARPAPEPTPAWAIETPAPIRPRGRTGPGADPRAEVEGGSGLFTVYALILLAVPTLGVSALIALFAVMTRPAPRDAAAASHFIFQQRTLWAGAVVALLGAVLIAVGLGVFVLFALAVWLIVRGAAGVLKLKAGRPIPHPRGWLY